MHLQTNLYTHQWLQYQTLKIYMEAIQAKGSGTLLDKLTSFGNREKAPVFYNIY